MHLMFGIRGHKHWQDRFIGELASRYLPFRWFNPEIKQFEQKVIEMRLCPIQLFDACFPEDCYDIIANTLFQGGDASIWGSPKLNKVLWGLRWGLGFDKLPEWKKDAVLPMQLPQHQEIFGIGVKKDYWTNMKTGEKIYNPTEEQKKDCMEGI